MVRSTVVLEIKSDRIEDVTDAVAALRLGYTSDLHDLDFTVGSVRHLVEPDTPKEPS